MSRSEGMVKVSQFWDTDGCVGGPLTLPSRVRWGTAASPIV